MTMRNHIRNHLIRAPCGLLLQTGTENRQNTTFLGLNRSLSSG